MRKIGKRDNIQLRDHQLKVLAGILSKAKDERQMLAVLNTIMTSSEQAAIAQRVSIISRIQKGKQYWEIESEFGTYASTISKSIDIYLKNGADNAIFNDVLAQYKEPKFEYTSKSKFPHKDILELKIGTRSLMRETEHRKKIWGKNINQSD